MSWNTQSQDNTSQGGGFNWALFSVAAAVGFFAGWIKNIVFALLGAKKKK